MDHRRKIAVIGHDGRQTALKNIMETHNLPLTDDVSVADDIVFPVMKSFDLANTEAILSSARRDATVYAGSPGDDFLRLTAAHKLGCVDYFGTEASAVRNAYITAEGALKEFTDLSGRVVRGSRITVVGFGRIGKFTAHIFSSLGAHVTVTARSPESRALAEGFGYAVSDVPSRCVLSSADCIINTVPARIISPSFIKSGTIYIELASFPYGFDPAELPDNIRYSLASGLPSRYAPESAAEIIYDFIIEHTGGSIL